MSIKIPVKFSESAKTDKPVEEVYALLSDIPKMKDLVPGLDEFKKVKKDVYRWKFKPMGMKGVSVVLEFDTKFNFKEGKEISWESIEGSGNAEMRGKILFKKEKKGTEVNLEVEMTPEIPVPGLLKKLAEPFVKSEFERMMKILVERVKKLVG